MQEGNCVRRGKTRKGKLPRALWAPRDPLNTLGSEYAMLLGGRLGRDIPLSGLQGGRSPWGVSRPDKVLSPEESTLATLEGDPVHRGWGSKGGAQGTLPMRAG